MKFKQLCLQLIAVTLITLIYSCKSGSKITIAPIPYNHLELNLPNCLKINDTLYIDKSEVTNIAYKEFMYSISTEYSTNSITYLSLYPEMTSYIKAISTNSTSPMDTVWMEPYHIDALYDGYPVVDITLDQAKKYSEWRSKVVFEMILIEHGYIIYTDIIHNRKKRLTLNDLIVKYSKDPNFDAITHYPRYYVPDSAEWNMVYEKCKGGDLKMGQLNARKSALKHQKNTTTPLSPAKGFNTKMDANIIYHLIGNVSELLSQEGYTAGGNYFQNQNELLGSNNIRKENTPSVTVGFRNFCEWVEIER